MEANRHKVNPRCAAIGCDNDQSSLDTWHKGICNQHKSRFGTSRCDCTPPFTLYPFPSDRTPVNRENWKSAFSSASDIPCNPDSDASLRVCSKHFIAGKPTSQNPIPTLDLCVGVVTSTPLSAQLQGKKRRRLSNSGIMKSPTRNSPRKNLRLTASAQTTPVRLAAGLSLAPAKQLKLDAENGAGDKQANAFIEEVGLKLKAIQEENDTESDSADRVTKVMFKLPRDLQTKVATDDDSEYDDIIDIDLELKKEEEASGAPAAIEEEPPRSRRVHHHTRAATTTSVESELQHFTAFIASHMVHMPLNERVHLQQNIIGMVLRKRML